MRTADALKGRAPSGVAPRHVNPKPAPRPRLFDGRTVLFVDQYGDKVYAKSRRDLAEKIGSSHIERMYIDAKGETLHCGYIIAGRWLGAFVAHAVPA